MSWYDEFKDCISLDHELKSYTSFRIGGRAAVFSAPRSRDELIRLYRAALRRNEPIHLLGGGYNLLVPDRVDGIVIYTGNVDALEIDEETVIADCGVGNSKLVATAAQRGLSGFECLAGIPGSVGGSVFMNAGGKFGEISEPLREIDLLDREGNLVRRHKDDIAFSYRHSGLDGMLIVGAVFKLRRAADRLDVKTETHRILKWKLGCQPMDQKSAGCIFRNPPGRSAGQVIDEAGLKGARIGGAEVSGDHANFIVNTGSATYDDVMALIRRIQDVVHDKTGIALQTEVQIWQPATPAKAAS